MNSEWNNKKVLVIGLGISGQSAARFLLKRGAKVTATDKNATTLQKDNKVTPLIEKGLKVVSESIAPDNFDLIVVSPGIPQEHPLYQAAKASGKPLWGEIELACRSLRQRAVAVTGTNGKTTTVMLITHALNHNGHQARSLGNIGMPLTDAVDETDDLLVVELSSWQLETLKTPVFEAAAVLNITPNHLDRHLTMEAYAKAKLHIAECLKPGGTLVLGAQVTRDFGNLVTMPYISYGLNPKNELHSDGDFVYRNQDVLFALPAPFKGKTDHDLVNLIAAYALCHQLGLTDAEFAQALPSFRKPAHRVEFVCNIDGVSFYDDSKGTNLEAVIRAVKSMKGETLLIAGGVHKGASYLPWAKEFKGKVRRIFAIGQAAGQIESELGSELSVQPCSSFEEAVRLAAETAKNGENVLLSPGCSSYDMFRDYNHRGDEFKRIVFALQNEVFQR